MKVLKKLSEYWKKLLSLPQTQALLNKFKKDPMAELQLYLWGFLAASLVLILFLNMCSCTPSMRKALKENLFSVADCSLHTSLGCAAQGIGGCLGPTPGGDYSEFAQCLVDKSSSCAGRGLALCAYGGMKRAFPDAPLAGGFVGCAGEDGLEDVKGCVRDVTIETEQEAVGAVADCYRQVCLEGPSTEP